MRIWIDSTDRDSNPELLDPEDFKGFKVVVSGKGEHLATNLEAIGSLESDEEAIIEVAAVKRMAGSLADDAQWITSFEAMINYAKTKGWIVEDGKAIRAHIERE